MLPAFRVKGLWPKPRGLSKSDGTHPLTGALLPKFETTETILQLPLNKYDELVADHPEYRLKYLDEDKDEITIGSEMELATKLEEPTTHSRLVQRSEDPRFYTSIPECMHAFHINSDEEARKLWTFFESSTISRNRAAHRLWTSPQLDPWNKVQSLLNEHAYEFMTGYNFEGFNSHYNYLSEAGQKIKDLAAKKDPSLPESMSTTSPATSKAVEASSSQTESLPVKVTEPLQAETSQQVHPNHVSKEINTTTPSKRIEVPSTTSSDYFAEFAEATDRLAKDAAAKAIIEVDNIVTDDKHIEQTQNIRKDDTFSLTHEKVSKSMASLNDELDKHLETAQALTRMLDQTTSPQVEPARQESLQRQLDNQFEMAKSATRMMNAVTKNRQPPVNAASQTVTNRSGAQDKVNINAVPSPTPSNPSLGFAKYATDSFGDHQNMGPKELDTTSQSQSFSIPQSQEHLTDVGMKEAREAGMKLRNQLYGSPNPRIGSTDNSIRRWWFSSSGPPKLRESKSSEKIAEPASQQSSSDTTGPSNKKKSVRFSFPSSARGEWLLDGTFLPGFQTLDSSVPKSDHPALNCEPKSSMSASLSERDTDRVLKLLKVFDEFDLDKLDSTDSISNLVRRYRDSFDAPDKHSMASTSTAAQHHKDNVKAKDTVPEPVQTPRAVIASETALQAKARQASDRKADSVETTVTKLWCQAYEGIISNIENFTEQLNTFVLPQISREQAAINTLLAQDPPSGPLEDDQTFLDNAKHAKDLLAIQNSIQQMMLRLKSWHCSSTKELARPGLCLEYTIDTNRVQGMIEGLNVLSCRVQNSFSDLFQTSSAVPSESSTNASRTLPGNCNGGINNVAEPRLQWIPRRYSSKADLHDHKSEFDKTNSIQPPSRRTGNEVKKPLQERSWKLEEAQAQTWRKGLADTTKAKTVTPQSSSTTRPFAPNRVSLPEFDFGLPGTALPPFRRQPVNFVNGQPSVPEPTESENEPSDTLLPNFPPLIPRRESQPDRHGSVGSTAFDSKSQSQPEPASKNALYPPFRRIYVHPSEKRYSVPLPRTQPESILTQPGWSWYGHHNTNEKGSAPYPNTSSDNSDKSKSKDTPVRSSVSDESSIDSIKLMEERIKDIAAQKNHFCGPMNSTLDGYGSRDDYYLPATSSTLRRDSTSRISPMTEPIKPAPHGDQFQLYQDIPEHKDAKTADKIMDCVEKLKDMGCSKQVDGGDARLVVYAQAAGGNLEAALDIMEEERQAYAEHKGDDDLYYD